MFFWFILLYSVLVYYVVFYSTIFRRPLPVPSSSGLLTTSPQWCFIALGSIEAVILHQGGLSNVYSPWFFQQGQQVNLSKRGSVVYNCVERGAVSVAVMYKTTV